MLADQHAVTEIVRCLTARWGSYPPAIATAGFAQVLADPGLVGPAIQGLMRPWFASNFRPIMNKPIK